MGHVLETELVSDPDGPTYAATTYDGTGKSYQVYNPTRCSTPTTNCGTETTWGLSTYTYDGLGRTTNVAEADGSAVTTSYSANCTTVTDEVGASRQSCADGLGRMTSVVEAPTNPSYEYLTTYAYDPLNDLTSVTQNGSSSSNARVRTFTYDSLSRLVCAANPEVQIVTCPTSATGTFPTGAVTYTYDPNGNLATRAVPKANQTGTALTTHTYSYDVLNRLVKESHADPAEGTELYAYDVAGLTGCPTTGPPTLNSPTNLGGRRTAMCAELSGSAWSYDPMGRALFEGTINKGTSAKDYTVGYTYFKDGSLKTLTYPSGDVVTYTVGGAGRTTQLSDSSNNYVGYSANTAAYTPQGALAGMTNGYTSAFSGLVTSNTYNDRLQPLLLSATGPDVSTSITLATFPSGCSGGCIATYTVASSAGINVGDSVTVAGNSNATLDGAFTVSAVATGSVTVHFSDESTSGHGTGGTMTDNTSGLFLSLCFDFHLGVASGTSGCGFFANTSGDNGSVFQVLNTVDPTRSAIYAYDTLNRVSQANTENTTSANCWGESYTIDSWGNLTSRSIPSGMSGSCITEGSLGATATTNNQLSGLGMRYDAAGNVTTDNLGNTPVYDQENRISTVAGYTYYYDADGARMEKTTGSAATMYWPGPSGTLTETSLAGTINEEYIYFNGERIARVDRPSGTVHYYFSNHLGSHTVVTSATGACEQDMDYYPYGGVITDHCPMVAQHYKFTGKERDTESSLDYFGARHYASTIGRFMTADQAADETIPVPLPFADFRNPQSLNLYSYALNNPVSNVDPDGHHVHVCVDNGNGGQNCYNLTDQQYADIYKQQNGQNGINLPGGGTPNGEITCGGQACGSATYFEPGLRDSSLDLALFVSGVASIGESLVKGGIGLLRAGAEEAGGAAAREGAAAVVASGGKAAIRDALENGAVNELQKQAVKRALARGAAGDTFTLEKLADGSIKVSTEVAGRAGGRAVYEKVIDAAGQTTSVVQKAYDASGALVHVDPKLP